MNIYQLLIPAYNASSSIAELLYEVSLLIEPPGKIIVVNDGSTDDTKIIAEKSGVKVISLPENKGKGAALITGFDYFLNNEKDKYLVCMDADLQHSVSSIPAFLDSKKIAIDISHASDALALDIFYFIDKHRLDIPVIASHSNFRTVFEHARNLPDELVQEIVLRKGLIGMNFLRAYIHPTKPEELIEHILYGFDKGAGKTLCFGADYFYTKDSPDKSRIPFYFAEHENAGKYPEILHYLKENIKEEQTNDLAWRNVFNFIHRIWS